MKFMIKAGLAAGLWLLVADSAMAQIAISPNGDELLIPSAEDQKCFENKLLRTVADNKSPDPREVIFDCTGGPLSELGANRRPSEGASPPPPPPPRPPRRRPFTMLLTPELASCILAHWQPARLLALPLALLSSPCPRPGR